MIRVPLELPYPKIWKFLRRVHLEADILIAGVLSVDDAVYSGTQLAVI